MKDVNVIWDRRLSALDELKTAIKLVEDDLKALKEKVASAGVDGYYSANSDVLRHAESVWRSCRQLQLLRELQKHEDAFNSAIEEQLDLSESQPPQPETEPASSETPDEQSAQ